MRHIIGRCSTNKSLIVPRMVTQVQLVMVLGATVAFVLAYPPSAGLRLEVCRTGGSSDGGTWASRVTACSSTALRRQSSRSWRWILQVLTDPVPGSLVVLTNGPTFGVFRSWLWSHVGLIGVSKVRLPPAPTPPLLPLPGRAL